MMSFALIISFILHAITFFIIVILYSHVTRLKETETRTKALVEEAETFMTSALVEMKEQNELLLKQIKEERAKVPPRPKEAVVQLQKEGSPVERDKQQRKPVEKQNQPENKQEKQQERPKTINVVSEPTKEDLKELLQVEEESESPRMRSPLTPKEVAKLSVEEVEELVISLQKEGLTLDEIAKYLHKGKTELELLLRFRQETRK
ncbi:hypothetical protein [Priestia koreensis]|uniref:hypothetical protein n=2 Tax=Priestia koreensis TaxID=284581 RepID=UPI00203AD349|nr:hypothetical protein [Priestia koreensis]MCM3003747.1 hypothetical protein [Priestia koreensis]